MNIFRFFIVYLGVFLAVFAMRMSGVDTFLAAGVGAFVVLIIISMPVYTLYFSRNFHSIDRFLKGNQKNPIFKFTYVFAHGTKEEELEAIERILDKYKQPMIQHTYLYVKALLQEDLQTAMDEAHCIPKEPHRSYSIAYVEALQGNAEKARSYAVNKPWMEYAIDVAIAYKAKDIRAFTAAKEQSLAASRGIQYYQNVASFKKMEEELLATL